jgi:hypothetical protein
MALLAQYECGSLTCDERIHAELRAIRPSQRRVGLTGTGVAPPARRGGLSRPPPSPFPLAVSPLADATTAAYRHVLEQGYRLRLSVNEQFDEGCNLDTPPFDGPVPPVFPRGQALGNQFVKSQGD